MSFRSASLLLGAALVVLTIAPALADDQPILPRLDDKAVAQPSLEERTAPPAARVARARVLVDLQNIDNVFQSAMAVMNSSVLPFIDRDNPSQASKSRNIIVDSVNQTFNSHLDQIKQNRATVYANIFTDDELQQLITFYRSNVGQKTVRTAQQVAEQSLALDRPVLNNCIRESMQKIGDQLRKNRMKVPKELGM